MMPSSAVSLSGLPWLTVALVCLGVFLAALDQTVVVTVLPQVMLDMKVAPTELDRAAWIVTGYLLGYTMAIPLTARLADVYGHARLFRAALLLFAAGSVLVALSPNLPWLVASRVVQALGGGATIPIGMALVTSNLPVARRALGVGIIGAAAEAGVVLGSLYGGAITALLDWRWVFWLNLPLVAFFLSAFRANTQRRAGRRAAARPLRRRRRADRGRAGRARLSRRTHAAARLALCVRARRALRLPLSAGGGGAASRRLPDQDQPAGLPRSRAAPGRSGGAPRGRGQIRQLQA